MSQRTLNDVRMCAASAVRLAALHVCTALHATADLIEGRDAVARRVRIARKSVLEALLATLSDRPDADFSDASRQHAGNPADAVAVRPSQSHPVEPEAPDGPRSQPSVNPLSRPEAQFPVQQRET